MTLRALLLFLLCGAAPAQDDWAHKAEQLKTLVSRPPAEWNDTHVLKVTQMYLDLYIDMLWQPEVYRVAAPHLPKGRPHIEVYIADELRTPIWSGGGMKVPVEYLTYLSSIGLLAGHDIFVDDHSIELPYPLLSAPFRSSRILPLLHPLGRYFEPERFASLQVYLMCPSSQTGCQTVQGYALMASVLFAVVHEISHGLLKHPPSPAYDLNKEIEADRNAYEVLTLVTAQFKSMPEELFQMVSRAFFLTPLVWFEAEASRASSPAVRATYQQRKKAFLAALPPDRRRLAEEFLQFESSSPAISSWKIEWTQAPDRIWVDGLSVNPLDLAGKTLTVSAQSHTVIAFRPGAIAIAEVFPHDSVTALRFQPLPPVPPTSEFESLKSQRKWAEILTRSTDENLKPRQPSAAPYHWEALRYLHLTRTIRIDDWKSIPEPMWRRVQTWERLGQPLASWR
jgi:hypothetical protein